MESEIALKLTEETEILFTALNFKQTIFEHEIDKKIGSGQEKFVGIHGSKFYVGKSDIESDPQKCVKILSADWELIADYGLLESNNDSKKYFWHWNWDIRGEKTSPFKEKLLELEKKSQITGMQMLISNGFIEFSDPMMISYLQAYVCEYFDYDYMYISVSSSPLNLYDEFEEKCDETSNIQTSPKYTVLGIKNIKWKLEKIEPVESIESKSEPKLEPKLD
jgi:hypothetical protein